MSAVFLYYARQVVNEICGKDNESRRHPHLSVLSQPFVKNQKQKSNENRQCKCVVAEISRKIKPCKRNKRSCHSAGRASETEYFVNDAIYTQKF